MSTKKVSSLTKWPQFPGRTEVAVIEGKGREEGTTGSREQVLAEREAEAETREMKGGKLRLRHSQGARRIEMLLRVSGREKCAAQESRRSA